MYGVQTHSPKPTAKTKKCFDHLDGKQFRGWARHSNNSTIDTTWINKSIFTVGLKSIEIIALNFDQ